ncbi:catalase family peroxidase [Sphingomonas faeni]|uniref:catalase family peroxidase n=1 Tax=Sphingomonas faeni TaxID=185950 RepID=UPI0033538324
MAIRSTVVGIAAVWLGCLPANAQTEQALPKRLPAQLVKDFHGAFGAHHARAVHAKGVILQGRFTPAPAARALSTAAVFTDAVPIIVRFSDFTGIPDIPDTSASANPRGFAVKFLLPDGSNLDIVNHSFNGFPVRTAAEFSTLLQALGHSPAGTASPTPFEAFLGTHPAARTFFTTQKPPPESFATTAFYGVNAFFFIDAGGKSHPVRYRFVPEAGEQYLDDAALARRSATYLIDDIAARVARAPVRFTWLAQLGEPTDRVDDPSVAWPETRRLVTLGVITIDRPGPDTVAADRDLLFLPGALPPGIAIADPMVTIRNAAYPVSFNERH